MSAPWITTVEDREGVKIGDTVSANDGDVSISIITHEILSKNMDIPVCVDIGVDRGWWSQFCLAVHPEAVIHAYEPNPVSFAALKAKFGNEPNITLYNRAVSDSNGTMLLHLDEGQSHSRDLSGEGVLVEKGLIDDLFAKVERVFLMKIDTEGHEPKVIRGLTSYLDRIDNIIFEFTPYWYGKTKSEFIANSGKLLMQISSEFPHLYMLSRRGPVKFYPIINGTIYDHIIFLLGLNLQVDIYACKEPLDANKFVIEYIYQ